MRDIVTLDLMYLGSHETLASYLVDDGEGGFVLFESGPGNCLPRRERSVESLGFDMSQLRAVFLTHIHLDHAGAAGELARKTGCAVFVHPAGEGHLLEPEAKLIPSARRLYGSKLPLIWGRMESVPRGRVTVSEHGSVHRVGTLDVTAWHTPGHARHHVAWQVGDTIVTGDVAGARFPGTGYVAPPMPPPDIDVDLWRASLELLLDLEPRRLLLTHFGPIDDVRDHLERLDDRIVRWSEAAREEVVAGGDVATVERRLTTLDDTDAVAAAFPEEFVGRFRRLCPMSDSAAGLLRYWRGRARANAG